jgi:hypothetical protein
MRRKRSGGFWQGRSRNQRKEDALGPDVRRRLAAFAESYWLEYFGEQFDPATRKARPLSLGDFVPWLQFHVDGLNGLTVRPNNRGAVCSECRAIVRRAKYHASRLGLVALVEASGPLLLPNPGNTTLLDPVRCLAATEVFLARCIDHCLANGGVGSLSVPPAVAELTPKCKGYKKAYLEWRKYVLQTGKTDCRSAYSWWVPRWQQSGEEVIPYKRWVDYRGRYAKLLKDSGIAEIFPVALRKCA